MPNISPIGGLSFFVHITINVVILLYKMIVKLFKLSDENILSNIFSILRRKESDNAFRKLTAYTLVIAMFIGMGTNFVLITKNLYNKGTNKDIISENLNVISNKLFNEQNENSVNIITEIATSTETEIATTSPFKFKNIEITYNYLPISESVTLVDFMRNVGILDTSFQSRAELALELGVIGDASEYSGSTTQNREIINKLKEELNKSIANHN